MKRILVTGGAGFLGSHLCKRLLTEGNEVICMDNYYTGSENNIYPFLDNSKFKFINHDITIPILIEVEEIYNLACPASPIHYQKDPIQTIKTNIYGVINMLELAKEVGAKFLQASTSEIYGDPDVHPQNEEYWGNVNPIGVRSCYDEGKRCAEAIILSYHRLYDIEVKIARIFNTYGPQMHPEDGRVISNLIIQSLESKPLTIYGNGTQTRSFCYVDDLIEGLVLLMNSDSYITGPINLGNDNEYTINKIAEIILEITGSNSEISFGLLPMDDPTRRKPDLTLAKQLLFWEPVVPLEEGIKKTVEYMKMLYVN